MSPSNRLVVAVAAGFTLAAFGWFLATQFDYPRALVLVAFGAGVLLAEALVLRRERRERQ